MTYGLPGLPAGGRALLLCGMVVVVTGLIHLFIHVHPGREAGRCLFLRQRPAVVRWLTGALSPWVSLACGIAAILLTGMAGALLQTCGWPYALAMGPVPGLLLMSWGIVASLRCHPHSRLARAGLPAVASLLLMGVCILLYIALEGNLWK